MRGLVVAAVLSVLVTAAIAPGPALAQSRAAQLEELWKQYPLEEGVTTTDAPAKPPATAAPGKAPPASAAPDEAPTATAPRDKAPTATAPRETAPPATAARETAGASGSRESSDPSPAGGSEWIGLVILLAAVVLLVVAFLAFVRGRRRRRDASGTPTADDSSPVGGGSGSEPMWIRPPGTAAARVEEDDGPVSDPGPSGSKPLLASQPDDTAPASPAPARPTAAGALPRPVLTSAPGASRGSVEPSTPVTGPKGMLPAKWDPRRRD